ncbi:laccase [Leucogyrophana mollusca]|uniref:Laccase n=1 Tax=Leucogyrophana mollusca TaxID=85980 RepID=A0ACB8B5W4_9AGAM|nr:laccase [Leucogyrophana mollusca]
MLTQFIFFFALFLMSNGTVIVPKSQSQSQPSVLGPVTQLNIVNKVISPDGFERSATIPGGMFPGPLIKANKGDDFRINVVNQLTDNSMPLETSVHWHGIDQHGSSWADGASFVTQCPIQPNNSFLHKFNALDQTGTYWYHSHFANQLCDGLRGPLIIYDPNDPLQHLYDVDDENTVITLADWYHIPSPILDEVFQAPVLPNSTLINGLGRYPGGPASPLSVINVQQGKRYRFRVIGLGCEPWFNFTIDGHSMTIIETDGTETVPVEVDSLQVFPAQRYSVIVTANQPVDNYWVRALSNLPASTGATFDGGQSSAILRYKGAPNQDPTTQQTPSILPFNEGALQPLINPGAPGVPEIGKADVNLNFVLGAVNGTFTMNNVSFVDPPTPVLLQILSGARQPFDLLPAGSVYELPPNKVIEISVPANAAAFGGPHPMHLHGHSFDVVRVAGNNTPNFVNPPRRDTVSTGNPGDNVTIRFTTDNNGPWFFHCHIDWHLHEGFAVVMAENPNGIVAQSGNIPDYWFDLCPANTSQTDTNLSTPN